MNWVSGAALTAAVSDAGCMGTLGPNAGADKINPDVEATGELMRRQIHKVRSLTEKPFAVNVTVGFGEEMKYSKKIVAVLLEEKVPAAIVSVGRAEVYTETLKKAGIKVLHAISTARHARKAQEAGVDAVICEGFEAGGIGDSRGVLAALALGADGIYMGSRFMVTQESESHDNVKQAVVHADDVCTVSVPKRFMLARDLQNTFTEKFKELQEPGASNEKLNQFLEEHSPYQAQHLGDAANAEIHCGQAAGLIQDIPPAAELIESIIAGLKKHFAVLEEQVRAFG
jgi:enoyl-[acyl-carrier protein] reductase II